MKLAKCVCGKTPKMYAGEHGDELRIAVCDCGIETYPHHNGNWCAKNWNNIQRELKKASKK